jgi:hypothetical protein
MEIRKKMNIRKGGIKGGNNERTTHVKLKEEKQKDNQDCELTGK